MALTFLTLQLQLHYNLLSLSEGLLQLAVFEQQFNCNLIGHCYP